MGNGFMFRCRQCGNSFSNDAIWRLDDRCPFCGSRDVFRETDEE